MCVCHLELGEMQKWEENEKKLVFHELGPSLEMFLLESYEMLS